MEPCCGEGGYVTIDFEDNIADGNKIDQATRWCKKFSNKTFFDAKRYRILR